MKYRLPICGVLAVAVSAASAQVASHAPTAIASTGSAQTSPLQVSDKPVARVNGAVLTDRDLLREMYAIFPYAQQHNGFPKAQEAEIRQGALEMIIFEELVHREAGAAEADSSGPKEELNRAPRPNCAASSRAPMHFGHTCRRRCTDPSSNCASR